MFFFFLFFVPTIVQYTWHRTCTVTSHTRLSSVISVIFFSFARKSLFDWFCFHSINIQYCFVIAVARRSPDWRVVERYETRHDNLWDLFSRFRTPDSRALVPSVAQRYPNLLTRFRFHVITYYNRTGVDPSKPTNDWTSFKIAIASHHNLIPTSKMVQTFREKHARSFSKFFSSPSLWSTPRRLEQSSL